MGGRRKRAGGFKRMTPQQRAVYAALRTLGGEMVVLPQDARPLRALQRRGLVRFHRVDSVRVARLRAWATPRRKRGTIMDWIVGRVGA